jgi:hypothetical protein
VAEQTISNSLRHAVWLEVCRRGIDVHRFDDRRWASCETLRTTGIRLMTYCSARLKTYQSHTGTQHLAERIKPDDPSATRHHLRLEFKIALGSLRCQKIVRVILDDEQVVFLCESEDFEFSFGPRTCACRVRSRGNGAVNAINET